MCSACYCMCYAAPTEARARCSRAVSDARRRELAGSPGPRLNSPVHGVKRPLECLPSVHALSPSGLPLAPLPPMQARSLQGHHRPHASFHLHSRPSVQATEGTPIFVQQGEQQGPMLVLTPHAKLGRRIRCPLALHMPPRRRLTDGLRLTQCLCRTHLHVRLPRRPRRHRNAQLECPM